MVNKSILKYRTRKANNRQESLRNSVTFRNAREFGILFTVENQEKHNKVKDVIRELEEVQKSVTVLSYLPKGKDNYEFLFDFFTKKEISYFGKFNNPAVDKFIAREFDFLLIFDRNIHPFIAHIAAHCRAKCRVGHYSERNSSFLEFMVNSVQGNATGMIEDMMRYIKKIN